MLYYLFNYLNQRNFPGAGVFNYVTFRAAFAIILLAGKGHENYQEINGVKNHFDDKEVLSEALKEA